MIEGPEWDQDLTYYLIERDPHNDLRKLEEGIPLDKFCEAKRNIDLEFQVIQKMTQHRDHVQNLFVSSDAQFRKLNRYRDILPYHHNRVILKDVPTEEDSEFDAYENLVAYVYKSDQRVPTYVNASRINSLVKSSSPAFISC